MKEIFSKFACLLFVIVLLVLFSSKNISAGNMINYGVIFAPIGDYASLNTKSHINMIQETVSGDWQSTLDKAEQTGQRLAVIPGWQDSQVCHGGAGWSWDGTNWSLNSNGTSFMDFIANYIKSGKKGFLSLYTVHEPYNFPNETGCTDHSGDPKYCCTTDVQKKLYSMLKAEAVKRGLTSDQLPLYADIDTMTQSDFGPGICDYCADWYYPNGECSGSTWEARVSSCISKMRTNYQGLAAKSPNSTFVAYAQSFGGISGYDMPTAAQMEYEGNQFINELKNNFSGNYVFAWYTWSGQYPTYLKNSPGGDASYQVMTDVYNTNFGSLATPTPTPSPSCKLGDVNCDGVVNMVDIGIIVDAYGTTPPSDSRADLNRDGKVNVVDIGIVIDNYGL